MDAFLNVCERNIPVIGLAIGRPGTKELEAARLSIECLPSFPVHTDEFTGRAFENEEGLIEIFNRIANGELYPKSPRKAKPRQFFVKID